MPSAMFENASLKVPIRVVGIMIFKVFSVLKGESDTWKKIFILIEKSNTCLYKI